MSLVRAFTTRRKGADKPSFLGRAASQKVSSRLQISGPINLISSTNVMSFEAPDIFGTVPTPVVHGSPPARSMSSGSRSSGDHSDAGSSSVHSRDYSTDASSVDDSPSSPDVNHLSCYFKPSVYTDVPSRTNSFKSTSHVSQASQASFDAPVIPQRAASHSKKAHMHVSRQRSISRLQSPPSTAQELNRDSTDFFRPEQPAHPFGKELEQLSEVAEEFGCVVRDAEWDADHVFMEAHDLNYFCATDYMLEIQGMLDTVFEEDYDMDNQAGWI